MVEVRETLAAARKELDEYRGGGGKAGASDHPAVKWHAALWEFRQREPGSEADALATAEAIQLLRVEEVPLLKSLYATYANRGAIFLGIGLEQNVARSDRMVKEKGIWIAPAESLPDPDWRRRLKKASGQRWTTRDGDH